MKYIWACSCGLETECESADFAAGAVFFAMIGYIRENAEGEYARYELETFEQPTKWVDNPT